MTQKNTKREHKVTHIVCGVAVMFWRIPGFPSLVQCETLLTFPVAPPGLATMLGGGMTARRTQSGKYANKKLTPGWFWGLTCTEGSLTADLWTRMGWMPNKQNEMFQVTK